ncbi:hypothetical protein YC2023_025012 [Brassica napus]
MLYLLASLSFGGDSLASIQETKVLVHQQCLHMDHSLLLRPMIIMFLLLLHSDLGLRSDIYLQCNQSLNQEPYEFSGTMKQNKFSIRISNKTSLDGRIFDELRVEYSTPESKLNVHFTGLNVQVTIPIKYGIWPNIQNLSLRLWWLGTPP